MSRSNFLGTHLDYCLRPVIIAGNVKVLSFFRNFEHFYFFFFVTPFGSFKFFCKKTDSITLFRFVDLDFLLFNVSNTNRNLCALHEAHYNWFKAFVKSFQVALAPRLWSLGFLVNGETYEAHLLDARTIALTLGYLNTFVLRLPIGMFFRDYSDDMSLVFRVFGRTPESVARVLHALKLLKPQDKYNGLGLFSTSEDVFLRLSRKALKKTKGK